MKSSAKTWMWIGSIGILVLIPTTGGKVFDKLTAMTAPKPPTPEDIKAIKSSPGLPADAFPVEAKVQSVAEKNAVAAKVRYLAGLKHFQEEEYAKAWEEWLAAKKLDPNNIDILTGLSRLKQISPKTKPK